MEILREQYKAIADEINQMYKADQDLRVLYMKGDVEWDNDIDIRNTKGSKEIIDKIGYPTISKVGKEVSHNFWILVQHADHDKEFQKYCLDLMKCFSDEDVEKINIAYLEDRIRAGEGRSILYGTQYKIDKDTDEIIILPIEDEENVDKRRFEIGLPPLKEYIEISNKKRREMRGVK